MIILILLLPRRRVATPVDWRQGGAVIVAPSVKPEDAPALFPKGVKQHEVPSGKVRNAMDTMIFDNCDTPGLHEDHTHAGIMTRLRLSMQRRFHHTFILHATENFFGYNFL